MLLTFSTLPLCLLGLYLLHLPLFAVAEISFYDPAYPPDKLKTGNWSTDVSKPCRDALKQPIKACSPILFRFLEGGSTFMNTYYPRPNFTDENLGELCTLECRQGLEQWVENQHEQCTDEDDIINENDGWGGAQFLYLEPGFMMRYYWNWCLRDVKTKEFCLPNRAKYEGLPKIKACATEEVLSHICDDSCLKQSLAFFSSVGRLGFASDTYDWGGHGVRIPRVEELCPNANLTEEIEFTFYPGYRKPEPVCEGEIVSELYTVGPPDEPDVPSGVTISNGDSEEELDDDLNSTDDNMDDSTDVDQDHSSADSTDVYGIPNRLKPTADTGYISGSSEEKSSAVQHLSMASLTIIGQISLLIMISIAI